MRSRTWLFSCLLLLQLLCCAVHGFLRLGTVGVSGTTGTVYLIDSNSLFLLGFTSAESLVFKGISGSGNVTATIGTLSSANMLLDGSDNWLSSSTIEVRTVSGDQLLSTFQVPSNIQIPCSAEYLGKFARTFGGTSHSLAGHVFYDRLNRRFFVAGLFLDGSAPAAYMWLDVASPPTLNGIIAGYNGAYGRVDDVSNQDANVTHPVSYTQTEFLSLSVWCEDFFVSFGHVTIPASSSADSFDCPSTFGPVQIGSSPVLHSVTGNVYVLGPNTIGLDDLNFDGTAPATHYWAGETNDVHTGFIVPSHTGSLSQLGALSNARVVLTLPTDFDVCSTSFLSLYCVQASVSFGQVFFNTSFGCSNCPPICKTVSQTSVPGFQCKELTTEDRVEYLYDSTNSLVTFKLQTCSLEPNQYFAFGLSASSSGTAMAPNADVVVCQFTATGDVNCTDYDLSFRSRCQLFGSSYFGACPDHILTGGVNNYINTQVERVDGLTTFTTTRAITTSDSHDKAFTPGTPQYIIWAKGGTFSSPYSDRWVLQHARPDRATTTSPIQIDFGATSSCANNLQCSSPPQSDTPWSIPPICIDDGSDAIQATLGGTGGVHGYNAITGREGWDIAWYLNGLLIPEVYVLRGSTVNFNVNGGDSSSNRAEYHPLYITSSNTGGINSLLNAGQEIEETVYAGLAYNPGSDSVTGLTVGPYCEWEETQETEGNFNTFKSYRETLRYSCSANVAAGSFEWTTDNDTSDVVYYQCATHPLYGWKIRVVDSLDGCLELLGNLTTPTPPTPPTPWKIPPICIDAEDTSIRAVIGSSNNKVAGNEGRKSIWYMNGLPSPEIYILRNTKVTFYVNGGNDHADPDNFHPLYLTNSSKGGLLKELEQGLPVNQTVYAGLQFIGDRLVTLTDGSLCKYSETQGETDFESFDEYQESLKFVCVGNILTGEFSWTPDADTPDTIYYQCAQHKDHGMKINVVDDIEYCRQQLAASGIILPVAFLLVIGNFLALYYSL